MKKIIHKCKKISRFDDDANALSKFIHSIVVISPSRVTIVRTIFQWWIKIGEFYSPINTCPFCGENLGGATSKELRDD
jgi:hypothetical protein